jgi:hypothetical protein
MFSLDTTGLIDQAADIFNGLQGIVIVVAGLSLGFALVQKIGKMIGSAVK